MFSCVCRNLSRAAATVCASARMFEAALLVVVSLVSLLLGAGSGGGLSDGAKEELWWGWGWACA